MKYKLKGYQIYELGQRKNQEDSLFPKYEELSDTDRMFVLCDGMGGHEAGEVASQTVCQAFGKTVQSLCPHAEGRFSDAVLEAALTSAFDALDAQNDNAGREDKKMGTTMTFLKLHDTGATIAHIGDSRVYHIRPGKDQESTEILFQTEDHSLVNDLVRIGEITKEEARHSQQKNVITRAMQPDMVRRPKADIYHTSNILPGDYFFLCSDGMLEQMEESNLRYIFSNAVGDAEKKVEMLKKVTSNNSDNHSAILVHILSVTETLDTEGVAPKVTEEEKKVAAVAEPVKAPVAAPAEDFSHKQAEAEEGTSKGAGMKYFLLFLVFALVCFAGYWFFKIRG